MEHGAWGMGHGAWGMETGERRPETVERRLEKKFGNLKMRDYLIVDYHQNCLKGVTL
jgi:hypothetical protein